MCHQWLVCCRLGSMSALKADTDFDAKVWVERILHGARTGLA